VKKRKLRWFPKLGAHPLVRAGGRLARFLVKSQILTIFFGLCVLGILVGLLTRPAPGVFPYAELFDQLQVVSYRDAPTDTSSRFVVQLCAGGKVFSQYDVDAQEFEPPPSGRSYARTITSTHYSPLRVRGHVGYGFWLEVPSRRSLLPEQYDELYQRTLNLMTPVSQITGVLGVLSVERRPNGGDACLVVLFSASLDQGRSFVAPATVSQSRCGQTEADQIAARRHPTYGDYFGLAATPDGRFRAVWASVRDGATVLLTTVIEIAGRMAMETSTGRPPSAGRRDR